MRAVVLAVALLGCGGGFQETAPLAVRPVEWNPSHADVGSVKAVADRADEVAVFGDRGATLLAAGAVAFVDRSVTSWSSAATIPAADGSGAWIVGVDTSGRVRRLRGRAAFEDVSARWGLESARVLGATSTGDRGALFLLDRSDVALADGTRVTRFAGVPLVALAGGGGVSAGMGEGAIVRLDLASRASRTYPLSGALAVAVDDAGKIYAATEDALYAEDAGGELALRFRAAHGPIHGLVASKGRVWFAEGPELGAIEGGVVRATSGAKVAPDARLFSSTSGDVWLVSHGKLERFAKVEAGSRAGPSADDLARETWTAHVQPIFARACAKCHMPDGPAGVDLSTYESWRAKREDVKERVLDEQTMPPKGHPLDDADREAIRQWIVGR